MGSEISVCKWVGRGGTRRTARRQALGKGGPMHRGHTLQNHKLFIAPFCLRSVRQLKLEVLIVISGRFLARPKVPNKIIDILSSITLQKYAANRFRVNIPEKLTSVSSCGSGKLLSVCRWGGNHIEICTPFRVRLRPAYRIIVIRLRYLSAYCLALKDMHSHFVFFSHTHTVEGHRRRNLDHSPEKNKLGTSEH